MPRLTDTAFVSEIANNSIPPTTDLHPTDPCKGISYTQQLSNFHDPQTHNNNVGVQIGDHVVANAPPLVVAPHRDYNTNNWSVHEMLVLQAAKLEFESNLKARRNHHASSHHNNNINNKKMIKERDVVRISSKERWLWIENTCWNVGVFRSQKQCHDKWEGLTTQFRKVARFNEKLKITAANNKSSLGVVEDYWSVSQLARKQNKLPANFPREVFNALRENHFGGDGGGGNCITTTSEDYSALRLGFTSNHHVASGGNDEAACGSNARPPNRKRRMETTTNGDEEGLEGVAAAILSAMERADERHKELMEFERTKFEFEKEKLLGFANLGNGVMRVLIGINEAIKERLDGGDQVTAHGKLS
jgi:hypothetical protein